MFAKRNLIVVTALFSVFLSVAGLAWACTRQANTSLTPQAGAAGTFLTITGQSFDSAIVSTPGTPTPVEIHWNSIDGAVLGTASGPDFAIDIQIPAEAVSGVSYVIAVQRDSSGGIAQKITRSFLVKATDSASTPGSNAAAVSSGDLWRGLDKTGAGQSVAAGTESSAGSKSGLRAMGLAMVGLALGSGALAVGAMRRRKTVSAESR